MNAQYFDTLRFALPDNVSAQQVRTVALIKEVNLLYFKNGDVGIAMNQQADDLFNKFCQRKHKTILEHLLKETPMRLSDIADLQALLSSKEKEALDEVLCNCIPGQCRCKEHLGL